MRTPSSRRLPLAHAGRWIAVLALVGGAALVVPSSEAAQHGGRQGSLSITPTQASPGEPLTLTGALPTKVRRPIAVQRGMYGNFFDIAHGRTDAHGRFRLQIPKNAMPSDPYRVVARKVRVHHHVYPALVTPARVIRTLMPDVEATLSAGTASPGQSVTLTATGTPVRPGRPMTLQVRTSPSTWQTLATGREDAHGRATFAIDPARGTQTYRVRAEAWHGAGWFPSFPTRLTVVPALAGRTPVVAARPATDRQDAVPALSASRRLVQPGPVNAANTYKWGRMVEDWAWETGESTDPWQIYSDGTGRANIFTGMFVLDSGPANGHFVDSGTTKATLHTAGHTYGRWEGRFRAPIFGTGAADFAMAFNLVPARTSDQHCGALSIDGGSWTGYGSTTTIGARKGGTAWSTTRSQSRNRDNFHTLAVEVTPKRIAWFIDHKVTAVLNNPAAVPNVPLVPQFVMQGRAGGAEMNHTKFTVDWLRYFNLKQKDRLPVKAPAPAATAITGGC